MQSLPLDNLLGGIETRWWELRAAEIVLEEAAAQFDGEDPLQPLARRALEQTKAKVRKLAEDMKFFGGSLELTEPDEEQVEMARGLMDKAVETHRGWLRCE